MPIRMLKFFIKSLLVIAVLTGIGYAAYPPIAKKIAERNKPKWRTVNIDEGSITRVVNATGTVRPVKKVQIGSFVSGPILDLFVEFNQEVKDGELLATIDPRLFAANVARDTANLAIRMAEIKRVEALLQQAVNDEARAEALKKRNKDFIAQSEMDQVKFNVLSLRAQLTIANASVDQAKATLTNSQANLDYCEIRSTEDGMIIDRTVEPGQTLAAQFQTPELFVIGVGMRKKMHIYADVDESEIGLIRNAADAKQPVDFTVFAYPDDKFEGLIEEVRFSSSETQNIVTYPVVVGAQNPDLKLLPGMTADLTFQVEKKDDVRRIPKSAIRFFPPDKKHVHPDDHKLIDGSEFVDDGADADPEASKEETQPDQDEEDDTNVTRKLTGSTKNKKHHVWKIDGELLRAVEVTVGLGDNRYWELVSGDLDETTELVTGQKGKDEE
jgi:HlyD family secretion protein